MARLTDDQLAELETEREFLLKSLDDLERERADGGIDEDTYDTLHSDYTARAAEVLRVLRSGRDDRPKRPPIPASRRALFVGLALVFAAGAAFALAKSAGTRAPGQTITGNNTPATTVSGNIPDTFAGHMTAGLRFENENDFNRAATQFIAASKKDPKKPDPLAELGWLLTQQIGASTKAPQAQLVDTAQQYIDRALRLDPHYVNAILYKGVLLLAVRNDKTAAVPLLRQYLREAPTTETARRAMATELIAEATTPTTTTVPSTTTTTQP
jgi:tetratricopeptide (TPR) repeat protein